MKMDMDARSLDNVLTFLADISSEVSIDFVCAEMSGEDDFCEEFCHGYNGPYKECWKHYLEGKWRRKDADDRAVKNTEDKRCIICLSRKETVDVGFQGENNIGVWFTLCKECANDLVKAIKGAYENG